MDEAIETGLDAEELTQLALFELERSEPARALVLLKTAVARWPIDGRPHYLLGVVHAKLGLIDRAADDMRRAAELAPDLLEAHFDLGLLELNRGRLDEARSAWKALANLPEEHAVSHFIAGMLAVAEGRLQAGIAALEAGLERDEAAEQLTTIMRETLEAARSALPATAERTSLKAEPIPGSGRHLLSRYESAAQGPPGRA